MAQNVIINGVAYANVPEVDIPKSGGGTAKFYDTAGADAAPGTSWRARRRRRSRTGQRTRSSTSASPCWACCWTR